MWVLEASGEILRGKRMWLRPGKQYLFGRVKKDGVRFAIDHKTVSRKHFIIDVSEVADGEVGQVHARTKITIIDQNSKSGTRVNGEELKGKDFRRRELKDAKNSVRPGTLDQELLITWVPCVVTFYLLKKEIKAGVLQAKQDWVRKLGIKAIADFLPDHTTHVVSSKRNTAKGLQGLISGKWLVAESFIEALQLQATPTTLSQDENDCQLELDFDAAWPQETEHLPPPGKEPTLRPAESYQPGPDRAHIFEDYTFVFCDPAQYDNLLPVITLGHGKALLFNITMGQTTVEEALEFVTNAAGHKTAGRNQVHSGEGGVIMLKFNHQRIDSEWAQNFESQVALKLDQRSIDQSEFLDAILANNAALLCQQIALESYTEGFRAPPPSAAPSFAPVQAPTLNRDTSAVTNGDHSQDPARRRSTQTQNSGRQTQPSASTRKTPTQNPVPSQEGQAIAHGAPNGTPHDSAPKESQPQPSMKKPSYRPPTQIKFDDEFNPDDVVDFDDDDDDMQVVEASQVEDSEPEATTAPQKENIQSSARKRGRSPSANREDVSAGGVEDLLPAANAMKRQRREFEQERRRKGEVVKPATMQAPSKPPRKELDVREAMKRQREREKSRADFENNEEEERLPPPDPNDKEPANLAAVEHMDIPIRQRSLPRRRGINPEDDPRWDERWNGLKNFKRFKPQEKDAVRRPNHGKVLVELVPVERKTGGMGQQYWPRPEEEREQQKKKKRREEKRRAQESLSQSQGVRGRTTIQIDDEDENEDEGRFRPGRGRNSGRTSQVEGERSDQDDGVNRTSPATARLQEEAAAIVDHDIDIDSPRRTRRDEARTQTQSTAQPSSRPSSAAGATNPAARGTKRPASSSTGTAAGTKRQKKLSVTREDSGDDSDDGKFRFGKGKGRRGRT
ncbi:uncharacterized protein HMPREF1541_06259 [Cyphellophora europaea CBS 101466]|uniref:FHA domain-containing protein n=1 Tax=Cyphellophora europaea (strain CBS 101466) TaxID=1220924 RepID=W2RR80_CYPE1|nr:uncharacterized protein HMPREF1541_06259 [Cyphellophora europaea CBS 101466]ETN38228.1 hypothetical protein HMPREF1541_06259 [Cyphellophora europaea CBS 101466]